MSKRSHHHNPAAHPRSRLMSARRKTPSLTHKPDPSASPTSSFSSVPRQQRVLNCGKQTASPPSSKRETDRKMLSHGKMLTVHADCLLEDIACVLVAQTKDAKIVYVIRCHITRTRIHMSVKRLARAHHNNGRNLFLPIECMLQTIQSLKTKKRTYSPGALFNCGRTGSDVIGCHRQTRCVFVCMLQTRVTLTASPIATPEDAVRSSHEGEQMLF